MEFIENLKKLLKNNNISKNKLAEQIGISEGTIRSWENGKLPTIDKLIKISQYFAISTDELLGLEVNDKTEIEKWLLTAYEKCNYNDKIIVDNILERYAQKNNALPQESKIS